MGNWRRFAHYHASVRRHGFQTKALHMQRVCTDIMAFWAFKTARRMSLRDRVLAFQHQLNLKTMHFGFRGFALGCRFKIVQKHALLQLIKRNTERTCNTFFRAWLLACVEAEKQRRACVMFGVRLLRAQMRTAFKAITDHTSEVKRVEDRESKVKKSQYNRIFGQWRSAFGESKKEHIKEKRANRHYDTVLRELVWASWRQFLGS